MFRHRLPAYSPLSLRAVLAGAATLLDGESDRVVAALLQAQYGPRRIVLTDSGTSALILALRGALAAGPGARVALPAYCCYDIVAAAAGADVSVVLYDVDPETLAPDLASLEAALRQGAGAVVVAHLYGVPVDLAPISSLAARAGALVIEDAAQGAGAIVNGRVVGTSGSLAILSFGRGKGVTAGAGGALLAHDASGLEVLGRAEMQLGASPRGWSVLGGTLAQWLLARSSVYALPASLPFLRLGETIYRAPRQPQRLSRCAAGVLAVTWRFVASETEYRRQRANRLISRLGPQGPFAPVRVPAGHVPGYLRLPVIASPLARREALTSQARRLGVMPGYPTTLAELEACRTRCVNRHSFFPGARMLVTRLCTLPTHSRASERDYRALEAWLDQIAERLSGPWSPREAAAPQPGYRVG